jgi:hypothetical protein
MKYGLSNFRNLESIVLITLVFVACGQATPELTATHTPFPSTSTHTPLPPTATNTLPPPTNTNTPIPPTSTHTPVPPTATPTATPVIQPLAGDWIGQTEDGFPISFTIVIQDEVTYLTSYKIIFEFMCNNSNNRFTMLLPDDFPIMDGHFEYRRESTIASGFVNAPDDIVGDFAFQFQDICDLKYNWKASPVNSE